MKNGKIALGIGTMCLCASLVAAQQTAQSQPASATKQPAQAKSALYPVMISTDLDCTLKIDDGSPIDLSVDKPTRMNLPPGDHLLVAVSKDGKDRQSQVVTLGKPSQKVVLVTLLKVQQARAQDERAKKELEDAKAEEAKDELDTAKAQAAQKEQQAAQRAQQQQMDASRKQGMQDRQKQLSDLRSQIDDLNNQIAADEDRAQEDERRAQELEQGCAAIQGPCLNQMFIYTSRSDGQRMRQEASDFKRQVRDLESQLRDLNAAPLQIQPQPVQRTEPPVQSVVPQASIDFVRSGDAYRQKGDYDHALNDYNEAIRLAPGNFGALLNRAVVYEAKGDPDRALQDLSDASRINPSDTHPFTNAGSIYMKKGDFDRAIQDFDIAIQRGANYLLPFYQRGISEFYQEKFAPAASDLEKAAEISPEFLYARLWLDIVQAHVQPNGLQALGASAISNSRWPAPLISLFHGRLAVDDVFKAANDPDPQLREYHTCEGHFYVGQFLLLSGGRAAARNEFLQAQNTCPPASFGRNLGRIELSRLGVPVSGSDAASEQGNAAAGPPTQTPQNSEISTSGVSNIVGKWSCKFQGGGEAKEVGTLIFSADGSVYEQPPPNGSTRPTSHWTQNGNSIILTANDKESLVGSSTDSNHILFPIPTKPPDPSVTLNCERVTRK